MNSLVTLSDSQTITTLQLREMINAARAEAGEPVISNTHFIDKVRDELDLGDDKFFTIPHEQNLKPQIVAEITIEQATLVGMRESKTVRRAVLDVLKEMQNPQFSIPTTLSGALRLAAEQAETIERQQLVIDNKTEQLAIAEPARQFVERYVEAKSSKSLSDVAKVLGWKPQAFIKQLAEDSIIFKRSGAWLPYQDQIDNSELLVQ